MHHICVLLLRSVHDFTRMAFIRTPKVDKLQKLPSHLLPKSPGWFQRRLQPDGLDHHGLRLLVLRLHVAVVLVFTRPHHLQLWVARLVQAPHRGVHRLVLHGQGAQRVGSPSISRRSVKTSLGASSCQRVLTLGVLVGDALLLTGGRLLLLVEKGELLAEVGIAVLPELVLDVVRVRLTTDSRAEIVQNQPPFSFYPLLDPGRFVSLAINVDCALPN